MIPCGTFCPTPSFMLVVVLPRSLMLGDDRIAAIQSEIDVLLPLGYDNLMRPYGVNPVIVKAIPSLQAVEKCLERVVQVSLWTAESKDNPQTDPASRHRQRRQQ